MFRSITDLSQTDVTFATIFKHSAGTNVERMPLACLRSLKLRHTSITEISVSRVISRCRALSRLDVSFTPIQRLTVLSDGLPNRTLTKLSLTSTPLTTHFLCAFSSSKFANVLTSLHTLQLGALGASPSSSISTLTDSLTLTDSMLRSLVDVLVDCKALESISLVGNTKLGLQTGAKSALAKFVRKVGRRCKVGMKFALSRHR